MPYADCSIRLWYETAGDRGSPVLLIMGLTFPGSVWQPQVEGLSPRHRVAWFDNRGVGGTEAPPGLRYSIPRMAQDASELLDWLGWDSAHIVGASMGGMIAQELALAHPERIRSLSLLVTHAGGLLPKMPQLSVQKTFVQANRSQGKDRILLLAKTLFPPEYLAAQDPDELYQAMRQMLGAKPALGSAMRQIAGIAGHNILPRIRELGRHPVLIVQAGKDRLIHPKESERLHRLIPGSRLVSFPEAGHGISGQCVEEINQLLLGHFRQADGAWES